MSLALGRYESHNVTLIGASGSGGVTFAFTERWGGCSRDAFASLNLGDACGDDPTCVDANRERALAAIGAGAFASSLVNPKQVHGTHIVRVRSREGLEAAQTEARAGADAIVCTLVGVPVLLCYADCVPVILVGEGGFAVVHSGWRGSLGRIGAKAARALSHELACDVSDITAYVGPHIREADYAVSPELITQFCDEFGAEASADGEHLNLCHAVTRALADEGVTNVVDACPDVSTSASPERFFSYRASGGACGRTGALAVMGASGIDWEVRR